MNLYTRKDTSFPLFEIELLKVSRDALKQISLKMGLALNIVEMVSVQKYFLNLNRNPTDVELQTIGQTWSEHCFHKTFKTKIRLGKKYINGLFDSFIAKVTRELDPSWCISVFEDNAGIVAFDQDYGIAVKIETHNHPSAIEPFGGAATGTGGVIRDILGVWADPIACTDVLCFGPLNYDYTKLPSGVKHPRYIYKGVIAGIGHYGNNMGIPTVNGAIFFDESYTGNVVVFCGCIGLLPIKNFKKDTKSGDVALLAGGKTGRDGIHGVTFASTVLTKESEEISRPAVQIPNPIEEEKLTRVIKKIREERLCSCITDLGGGGLSSAVGETASKFGLGVDVYLEKIPLKYSGLAPWEIWISESQERMLLTAPEKNVDQIREIFKEEEVEVTPIGVLNSSRLLRLFYDGIRVAEVGVKFLFSPPTISRKASFSRSLGGTEEVAYPQQDDFTEIICSILSAANVASREDIIRTYDHEVKGNTVIKPLQGDRAGPNDAAVLKPLDNYWKGIVISCGMNPLYGKIDPYWMAASAIDEAVRNNIAVGGRRIALLDNFTWGNPEKQEQLDSLVSACMACYETGKAFRTPFISGKDSLYNESPLGPVTPTLLITGLGLIPDIRKAITLDFKTPDNPVYIIGRTYPELGGSHFCLVQNILGRFVPQVRFDEAHMIMSSVTKVIDSGFVRACHDLSEGGLAVAAAEMSFTGGLGFEMDLRKIPHGRGSWRNDIALFSESNSRFLIEVNRDDEDSFVKYLERVPYAKIGTVSHKSIFSIKGLEGNVICTTELERLYAAWRRGVRSW